MKVLAAAILGSAILVAGPIRADEASRLQAATEVVDTTHAGDNMRSLLPTFMGPMQELILRQTPGDTKQVDTYVARFQQRFGDGIPKFVELVAKVYAREFSEEDLRSLLAFYQTPAGQHLLAKQAEISRSMFAVGQQWGKSIAEDVLAEMAKEKAAKPAPKL